MPKNRILGFSVAALVLFAAFAHADDSPSTNAPAAKPADAKPPAKKKQAEVASKTAAFDKISKTDETYKTALDAHALEQALKQVDKDGAFKGTVSAVFEPRAGGIAILNFDENYKTALTALLKDGDFAKFPDLKTLVGKDVLVSGKFASFQGRAEIILTNTAQIKLVEAAK